MKSIFDTSYMMKINQPVLIAAMLILIGCATMPEKNVAIERARNAYEQAQANPEIAKIAPVAMYEASQAMKKSEQAKDIEEKEHLAYIAERKTQIAMAQAEQKIAKKAIEELSKQKDKILLQARELEAKRAISLAEKRALEAEHAKQEAEARALDIERAKGKAEALAQQAEKAKQEAEARALELERAKGEAETKALEAEKAKKEVQAKALELEKAKKEAEAKKLEAEMARLKTEEVISQRKQLESELIELKAKQTDKGVILTLGYILFETKKAILMSGAMRTIDTLSVFLKKYPKRNVLIEGFTDSAGSETFNLELSQQRADAVRDALITKGVAVERITTKGYGKLFPVASNETAAGKQQNRRVEIIILDEGVNADKMLR